jgi:hypothetical protein
VLLLVLVVLVVKAYSHSRRRGQASLRWYGGHHGYHGSVCGATSAALWTDYFTSSFDFGYLLLSLFVVAVLAL